MKSELTINKRKLVFTSLNKLLFPADGIIKAEVVEYYLNISPYFLKYTKNRPLTLQRFPKNIESVGFIQKHADFLPEWIKRIELPTQSNPILYVVASKKADLGYLANLNTIAFHAALSTVNKIDYPDMLIWDLDPSDGSFEKVIKVAFKLKKFADEHNIKLLVKTTGSEGLHLHAPLDKQLSFDKIHAFSKSVANLLAKQFPKEITTAQHKEKREGKVFIDYMRNSYGQTAVSPYSLRPLPGAPIASPIQWEELGRTVLSSKQFNISNIFERLKEKGDVWAKDKISNSHLYSILDEFAERPSD